MRNNKFDIGDRVSISGYCRNLDMQYFYCEKEYGTVVGFVIANPSEVEIRIDSANQKYRLRHPHYPYSTLYAHIKQCVRLVKRKPVYINIRKDYVDTLLNTALTDIPDVRMYRGKNAISSYCTFKLIRTKK